MVAKASDAAAAHNASDGRGGAPAIGAGRQRQSRQRQITVTAQDDDHDAWRAARAKTAVMM